MRKIELVLLTVILLVAFTVRLYKLDSPLADWHSWRQADTSAVSRNFAKNGFDLLHPRFDDLSNVPSGKDNPNGYRFVEFPIYNAAQASLFILFDHFTLEEWGRMVSIFASLASTLFIYLIVKKYADITTAFFSTFFYAMLPFSIYFGRTILPDQSMVMAILGGIYFFGLWLEENKKSSIRQAQDPESIEGQQKIKKYFYYLFAFLFISAALLLKPYALFFTLPMIYLAWRGFKFKMFTTWQLWLFLVISVAPLIWWRWWMMQYPEGIPVTDWLFDGGNIRFKGAFFYWIFADRLGRLILGYWGIAIFFIGLLVNSGREHLKRNGKFFYVFLLSSLLYLTVIARGNVQHDYYQILIVPSIAICLGFGARALLFPYPEFINKTISRIVLFIAIIFTFGFSWYFVRDYYNINYSIVIAGQRADHLLPKDAKVIAPLEGDTTFLYHTKRVGWASFQNPLPELIAKGATHLILVNPSERDFDIGKEYKIIADAKEYLIFDLRSKP